MTGVVLELAKTIRKETNGRKLSVFFYGYSYEFSSVSKGPAASAHYALRDLLESPDIDIICSPISYSDRKLGGGCSCMLNAESVTQAGKLYLYEDDSRTFLARAAGVDLSSTTNVDDSISVLLRNSAQCALRNFGTWLMDLGSTGWYDSPELWQASASLEKLDRYFLENPTPYLPEVGVFLGEESMLKISSGKYSGQGVSAMRIQLNRLGAPYAQYELADLLEGRVDAPKLTIILNNDALDDETLRRHHSKPRRTRTSSGGACRDSLPTISERKPPPREYGSIRTCGATFALTVPLFCFTLLPTEIIPSKLQTGGKKSTTILPTNCFPTKERMRFQ